LLKEAAQRRPFTLIGPDEFVSAAALARRAMRLDPQDYQPAPLYLRAPHVTLPA
jgi:hypothetical protein